MQNIVINNQTVSLQSVINDALISIEKGFKGVGNFTPEAFMEMAKMLGINSTETKDVPKDYLQPNWNGKTRIYEWKNYISQDQQAMWDTYSDCQKASLAMNANKKAMSESWE
jgi:hypothetical protein